MARAAPTAGDMAMNALIFGYAGHSLVTPHAALKQMWWTDDRIEAKVTRKFVLSKLRGEERRFLKHKLAFAGELSDKTYLDYVLDRTKRLFLILTEIGASDQIFGCIDDGWTDEDLPIALEDITSLDLSYKQDDALNQRFYKTQYMFLLRTLEAGAHVKFGPQEHIPLDQVNTLPPAVSLQAWERINFPSDPSTVFIRRRIVPPVGVYAAEFHDKCLRDIRKAQQLPHPHISSAWASYVSEGSTYVLSDFVPEHTLLTFLEHRTPMQFVRLPLERRPILLCEWMHCLADAIAYLHHNGVAHGAIRPSNIIIDRDNRIAFSDIGTSKTFQLGKKRIKHESRDYTPPEVAAIREVCSSPPSDNCSTRSRSSSSSKFSFRSLRKLSISSSGSSASRSSGGFDSAYGSVGQSRPASANTLIELPADIGSLISFAVDFGPAKDSSATEDSHQVMTKSHSDIARPVSLRPFTHPHKPGHMSTLSLKTPPGVQADSSDIFSLGCIFLDIITFVLRGKLNDFVKFRSAKVKAANGKISMDSSFHADPAKVEQWIDLLIDESWDYADAIYRGLPDMLLLVRCMLVTDPALRPTACHVRDRIGDILAITCGVEDLCCADRVWNSQAPDASLAGFEAQMTYPNSQSLLQVRQSCLTSS